MHNAPNISSTKGFFGSTNKKESYDLYGMTTILIGSLSVGFLTSFAINNTFES